MASQSRLIYCWAIKSSTSSYRGELALFLTRNFNFGPKLNMVNSENMGDLVYLFPRIERNKTFQPKIL